jgi:hypothetical protein
MGEKEVLEEQLELLRTQIRQKTHEIRRTGGFRVIVCDGCGDRDLVLVQLRDELWRQLCKFPKELLCLECMEKRLGRLIVRTDLKECGGLRELEMGYKILSRKGE